MKKISASLFLTLISCYVISQTLKVIDYTSMEPIERVAIFNLSFSISTLTNKKGEANIDKFKPTDTLFFQHTSYHNIYLNIEDIIKRGLIIMLQEKVVQLNPTVISPSKREQKKSEVPTKIVSITTKEIAFENPQTTADLLGYTREVFIQKSQLGGGSPMIRGFSANSVLLVIDGVRMNNAIYRSGNLQNVISIDANTIENAEVVFGPGSVIYGSDALGGVMDFHTKTVKLAEKENNIFNINAFMRYSTANNEKTAHFDLNYGKKKWGLISSITYSDYNDLKMGVWENDEYTRNEYIERINDKDSIVANTQKNLQKFTGYNQLNILQKFKFRPNKKINVDYGFHYSTTSDIPRYDRLLQHSGETLKYSTWNYGPQKWSMHVLNLSIEDSTKFFDDAKLTVAFQNIKESRIDRKFKSDIERSRFENVKAYSLNFDLDKQLTKKSSIFYGLEAVINTVISTAEQKDITTNETAPEATRYPDGNNKYSTYAAYINFKSNISKKTTLIAGVRFSYVFLNSEFIDTSFYNFPFDEINIESGAQNGCVGIVFRPTKKWQLNANLSSGFRAPNIDDVGKVFDSEPGNVVVPNNDLSPEYVYNIDFGILRNIDDAVHIDLTFFYTVLFNVIVRRDFEFNGQDSIMYEGELSKVQAMVNSGRAIIYGGSFSLFADFSSFFSIKTNLTYTQGRETQENVPLRHVTPLFGSTALIYKAQRTKFELFANYNGRIKYINLAPSEQAKTHIYTDNGSPAWWTLNIKGSYYLNSKIQFDAGIENILNKRYRPYSSGICAPGINFIVTLRITL